MTYKFTIVNDLKAEKNVMKNNYKITKNFNFLAKLAMYDANMTNLNRESSTLYSIRIQLERFNSTKAFNAPQFGLISRRFVQILKLFTISISR